MGLSSRQVDRYLARLGFDRRPSADARGLRSLQRAHLRSVPFENLDIHLGQPIELDVAKLHDKVVRRHRGGFCYELNGLFGALLEALGFRVDYVEARVHGPGGLGIRFDHLCLLVDASPRFLVDVGFGDCFDEPLVVAAGAQRDPAGDFELIRRDDGWYDLLRDAEPQYRFSPRARTLGDFAAGCRYHQSSAESHFTQNAVCSIRTDSGRVTIRGDRLIETVDGARRERELGTQELAAAYATRFGLRLEPAQVRALYDASCSRPRTSPT